MADDDFCYLTTTGRVSGRPHEIEIWYARSGDTLYLLSGAREGADWVRNLIADPECSVRIGARSEPETASGRVLAEGADSEEDATARRLVFEKYQPRYDGDLSGWRDSALPVAVTLEAPSART